MIPNLQSVAVLAAGAAFAIAHPVAAQGTFVAGPPLGVTQGDQFVPMSDNAKVYGGIVNTESCIYDETRGLIIAPARGVNQNQVPNDAFVALINPDGSVHTPKWIGLTRDGLVLNHPLGSDIAGGKLILADRDGGTSDTDPSISVLRMFDIATGAPAGEIRTEDSTGFNDIAVAADGTIYASQTGAEGEPDSWRIYEVSPEGASTVLIQGEPLERPNGVAIDNDGNIVVVMIGDNTVRTFSPAGELLGTEEAVQPGNDGLVIMPDGTKYVSSVRQGGISRIRPGEPAELIASGIPSAASMCYDAGANQLVIPMNPNNGLTFVKIPK